MILTIQVYFGLFALFFDLIIPIQYTDSMQSCLLKDTTEDKLMEIIEYKALNGGSTLGKD